LAHGVPVSRRTQRQSFGDGVARRDVRRWSLLRNLTPHPVAPAAFRRIPAFVLEATADRARAEPPRIGRDSLLAQDRGRMLPIEPAAEDGTGRRLDWPDRRGPGGKLVPTERREEEAYDFDQET
jgi:hypothetical protein